MNAILNSPARTVLLFSVLGLLRPAGASAQPTHTACGARAITPDAPRLHADLLYATHDGAALKLDLVLPRDAHLPYPVVIVLHGTGTFSTGRIGIRKHAEALGEGGFAALAVGFRHESKVPFPGALKDVDAAVDWIHANADKYKFDKNRIGLLGFSGGGSLATLVSTKKPSRIRAVVCYFAPSDLKLLHQNSTGYSRWFIQGAVEQWLGGTPEKAAKQYQEASPITHVHKDMAPHLLISGTADAIVPVEHSRLLAQKMKQAGAKVNLLIFEGAPHNFDEESSLNAKLAFSATEFFLAEHLMHGRVAGANNVRRFRQRESTSPANLDKRP